MITLWLCFRRLSDSNVPTTSAISGEVVSSTVESKIVLRAAAKELTFRPDPKYPGVWKLDGDSGKFLITAASPDPIPQEASPFEP